jgi:hypothetical protein
VIVTIAPYAPLAVTIAPVAGSAPPVVLEPPAAVIVRA